MAEKRRLLSAYHDLCIVNLEEAHEASSEILRAMAQALSQRYPTHFRLQGQQLYNLSIGDAINLQEVPAEHALETACRLVQEDLYIMQQRPGGDTHLTAAAATFLQRVDFTEKLGRSLAGVHAPVPFYDQIAKPMINVFGKGLRVGRPLERFNWALTDDPAFFQPELEDETPSAKEVLPALHPARGAERMTSHNAGSLAFLRSDYLCSHSTGQFCACAPNPRPDMAALALLKAPVDEDGEVWSSGLCDCFSDCGTCCLGCWCPCILFGQNAEKITNQQSCCSWCCAWCLIGGGAHHAGCGCCIAAPLRKLLRGTYQLKNAPCSDCCVHWCCATCALCQEARELEYRASRPPAATGPHIINVSPHHTPDTHAHPHGKGSPRDDNAGSLASYYPPPTQEMSNLSKQTTHSPRSYMASTQKAAIPSPSPKASPRA
ncbi:hypothetical protein WJX73_007975 [Symbiochloris irregularis]|uniref:Uncharacterized protein n=1 Tax=Symbiochloris irregularis TaxID=706552 RepID=A0AAW1NUP5_9CHLO